MQIKKEKAINLILLGLAVQYVPLIPLGIFAKDLNKLPSIWSLVISFSIIGFFIWGYIFLLKGCRRYVQSKGYSSNWGWLGLLSIFGLSILLLIPDINTSSSHSSPTPDLSSQPFNEINVPELLLSFILILPVLFYLILIIFSAINNLSFPVLIKSSIVLLLVGIARYFCLTAIMFRIFQKTGVVFGKITNYKNNINFKLILFVATISFAFSKGLNSLTLYNLSFLFPSYVEDYINEKDFTNIPEIFLYIFMITFLAPAMEELLFRGIILQKWSIKWGVRSGILTSSLLFAVIHFNFSISSSLFIKSIMFSVLYFKTRNLITPILCHCFYKTIGTIFQVLDFFSKSPTERTAFISVSDYQTLVQPLLGQRVLLVALTVPLIGYFLYKNFPKNDVTIPYFDSGS